MILSDVKMVKSYQREIAVVNLSTAATDTEVKAATTAVQKQVTRDFYPVWDFNAHLTFYADETKVPPKVWLVSIFDDADVAGAGGYHDLTKDGQPLSKVFAKTEISVGSQWTTAFSHEVLEMMADPWISCATEFKRENMFSGRTFWLAYEVCDPCETDEDGYKIDNVLVSDFVYPEYLENWEPVSGRRYDFMKLLKEPLDMRPGGYLGVKPEGSGWTQIFAKAAGKKTIQLKYIQVPRPGSRRERRMRGKDNWIKTKPLSKDRILTISRK
jgi:hypothetical protein